MAQRAHRAFSTFHQRHAGVSQWKQYFGVDRTANHGTESCNRLVGGSGSIGDRQRKPVTALDFFGPGIVGLQVDGYNVDVRIVDECLKQTGKYFFVVVHGPGTVERIVEVAEIGQDFG